MPVRTKEGKTESASWNGDANGAHTHTLSHAESHECADDVTEQRETEQHRQGN